MPRLSNSSGIRADAHGIFVRDMYYCRKIGACVQYVIDIGANIGLFSIYARALWPDAIIHGYEPQPEAWPWLSRNYVTIHGTWYPEAVGLERGWCVIEKDCNGLTNQARTMSSKKAASATPKVSLAEAIQRIGGKVDVLKLDCEGAEWEILKDRDSLSQVTWICMEYHFWALESPENGPNYLIDMIGAQFKICAGSVSGSYGTILAKRI